MNLNDLKNELASRLLITKWSPSDDQLKRISKGIRALGYSPTINDISLVVLDVVGNYESMSLEGIDNSDLKTLLLLATKIESEND